MMKKILAPTLMLGLAITLTLGASANDALVRFRGGIGVLPVKRNVAPFATNIVLNVNPASQPWVIESLSADVKTDGRISVDGRGLLLRGGEGIGGNGAQSVRARLFCDGQVSAQTGLVPLQPDGGFRIDGALNPVPAVPCNRPVLLIVGGGGNWFAAGMRKH